MDTTAVEGGAEPHRQENRRRQQRVPQELRNGITWNGMVNNKSTEHVLHVLLEAAQSGHLANKCHSKAKAKHKGREASNSGGPRRTCALHTFCRKLNTGSA